jgi:osmoprotectant transport system ATP-binding protein
VPGVPVIEFEGVTKVFPDGTVAVDGLSLTAPTGRITVMVGPSGSGKTSILRMVNRLLDPSAGRILIDGTPNTVVRRSQLRRGIGYVIQQAGLFPHRTVVENIETVPLLLGTSKRDARRTAEGLLERVGLSEVFADRYPAQLSGGQQQRVGLARALAADPPILLMDEPFSALDPVVRGDLQDDLLDLQQVAPKTIVFVTHDIDEAIKLGDQIAVLDKGGRLVQLATPETLLSNPGTDFVADFLGRDRGIRKLTFLPAAELPLSSVATVQAGATGARARAIADGSSAWLLVLDMERRPRGWVDTSSLRSDDIVTGSVVHALGGTFYRDESVLAALDAAILSPPGLAVCINDDGDVVGVVSHAEIARYLSSQRPDALRSRPTPALAYEHAQYEPPAYETSEFEPARFEPATFVPVTFEPAVFDPEPEPAAEPEPEPAAEVEPEPEPAAEVEPEPEPRNAAPEETAPEGTAAKDSVPEQPGPEKQPSPSYKPPWAAR